MTICNEFGEIIVSAPYQQYLNSGAPLVIPHIIEHFADEPGIEEGDIFVASDPWIGASHQMDVCISGPIFVEGKVFGWISNAAHQYDLGGIVPGGWPQNAPDVYSDPILFTPFKLVEKGVLRNDLDQMYRRHSRMPDLVALDLRAQIAGCTFAIRRIQEACEEFGAPTVKAAMSQVLDRAQSALASKLSKVPDGSWTEVRYFDEQMPGDRKTHRTQLNLHKRGDRLSADNIGTEEQAEGPNGFTFMNFEGGMLGALSITMLYEHSYAFGGASRQLECCPLPGLLTCVDYPAAVSGGVVNTLTFFGASMNAIARMLVCDPDLKRDIVASGSEIPLVVVTGTNDRGVFFGTGMMDNAGSGSGARSYMDGNDTAGPPFDPLFRVPNVEPTEAFYPLLYLYRRETEDSGGAGRWRGGCGMTYAFTPYRADSFESITNTGGMGVSTHTAMGVFGGYPAPTARYEVVQSTDLEARFERGEIPRSVDELESGTRLRLRAKTNGTPLQAGDVFVASVGGGGGYGDPLEREPERVARDVELEYVSREAAADVYGVALDEQGGVDESGTADLRRAILERRSGWTPASERFEDGPDPTSMPATGEEPQHVHEYLVMRDEDDRRVIACSRCDHIVSDGAGSYKLGLLVDESPVTAVPTVDDPAIFLDEEMVFRQSCCPGCQVLISAEILRASEPAIAEALFV
jgi:N-methylhydantoinase B